MHANASRPINDRVIDMIINDAADKAEGILKQVPPAGATIKDRLYESAAVLFLRELSRDERTADLVDKSWSQRFNHLRRLGQAGRFEDMVKAMRSLSPLHAARAAGLVV